MEATLRKMGNSQGILIPKPLLRQLGLEDKVELQVKDGALVIRPLGVDGREGWAGDAKAIALAGDDPMAWPEFGNEGDAELAW